MTATLTTQQTTTAGHRAGPRTVSEVLTDARNLVAPSMRATIDRLTARIGTVAGYHLGWLDEHGARVEGDGGKAIRAALAVTACEAAGGTGLGAVPAAVAVELAHNAGLLHDDIIDEDRTRRGRDTAWVVFGTPAALLVGDALFLQAATVLAEAGGRLAEEGLLIYLQVAQRLFDGEYVDTMLEDESDDLTVARIEAMCADKTGSVIALSCALGALAAGAHRDQVAHLQAFGNHIGLAFQYVDDSLGLWGSPDRTGKPVGADLAAHKKSLPITYALTSGTPAAQELAGIYADRCELSPDRIEYATGLVESTGARAWARARADAHIETALAHLSAARPEPAPATELANLARHITSRDN